MINAAIFICIGVVLGYLIKWSPKIVADTNSKSYDQGREDALQLITDTEKTGAIVEMLNTKKILPVFGLINGSGLQQYHMCYRDIVIAGWALIDKDLDKASLNKLCATPEEAYQLFKDRKDVAIEINLKIDELNKAKAAAQK